MSGRHSAEPFRPLIFDRTKRQEFAKELKQEVNDYFRANSLKHTGGVGYAIKVPLIAAIYLVPYILILTGVVTTSSLLFLLAIVMGIGLSCIGFAIMHDANHGSVSSSASVNKWLGYSLNFLGGHAMNWKIQHNVLHHTFTNIHGYDEDIISTPILRFTPTAEWRWFHKYQHIYAPFLYSLLTVHWTGHSDFTQLKRYEEMGLLASQKTNYKWELIKLSCSKILYFVFSLGLPLVLTTLAWWQVVLGFFIVHFVAGQFLSLVFQAAHVTEMTDFMEQPLDNRIEENFMVHQLRTTRNFGTKSKWFTWMVGGLNHQIEHHLFPNISHVHYPAIALIVRGLAKKHDVVYYESPSFFDAVFIHFRFLKELGKPVVTA